MQAKILEAVVGRFPDSAKAEQRAAGAAWLTALLQHVGPSPLILARLSAIQEALIPVRVGKGVQGEGSGKPEGRGGGTLCVCVGCGGRDFLA